MSKIADLRNETQMNPQAAAQDSKSCSTATPVNTLCLGCLKACDDLKAARRALVQSLEASAR